MDKLSINSLLNKNNERILNSVRVPYYQFKSLKNLKCCRTSALGGHAQYCPDGHLNGVWYNSCKQRGCPQCQGLATEEWLHNTQSILLDRPHHHIVFTIPSELNIYWSYNRALFAEVLFSSVRETIKAFSQDKRYLDATPGSIATLHTWGRNLGLHPHIHLLITHGGLNVDGEWVEPKKKHLFPQKPVMMVFRGKFLARLKRRLKSNLVEFPEGKDSVHLSVLMNKLGRKDWMVHFCPRYDYASGVAKYLARYVKNGPIRNSQIKPSADGTVRFQYKSHQTGKIESMILGEADFMQRLAQHTPLPRQPSVRYGGLYSSSCRVRLNCAREHLRQQSVPERSALFWIDYLESKGIDLSCDTCGLPIVSKENAGKRITH